MKLRQMSFMATITAATLTIGCATTTTGASVNAPPVSMSGAADAVIYINGMS